MTRQSKAARKGKARQPKARRQRPRKAPAPRKNGSTLRVAREARSSGKGRVIAGKFIRAALVVAACLAAGAGAGAGARAFWTWLSSTPRLAIQELTIKTGPKVPEREVRMLADIAEGDNILGFRLMDCVRGIEVHPWVKKTSVMRVLPDKVKIEVLEREPVAAIVLGALYYVDADGEVFKKIMPGEDMDFPVITGVSLGQVVEDKEEARGLIRLATRIIELAEESEVMTVAAISEIYMDRIYGSVVVRTGDGMRIRFGREGYRDKFLRLEKTLLELGSGAAKVAELDLSYHSRVTIKLRDGYRVASASEGPGGM